MPPALAFVWGSPGWMSCTSLQWQTGRVLSSLLSFPIRGCCPFIRSVPQPSQHQVQCLKSGIWSRTEEPILRRQDVYLGPVLLAAVEELMSREQEQATGKQWMVQFMKWHQWTCVTSKSRREWEMLQAWVLRLHKARLSLQTHKYDLNSDQVHLFQRWRLHSWAAKCWC